MRGRAENPYHLLLGAEQQHRKDEVNLETLRLVDPCCDVLQLKGVQFGMQCLGVP
jgi:hypothetical protein